MKVLIFGMNSFSDMFSDYLEQEKEHEIVGYLADRKYLGEAKSYRGKPVTAFEDAPSIYAPAEHGVMLCLGYTNMNKVREERALQAEKLGYTLIGYIHPTATVLATSVGKGNLIMEGAVIGNGVTIGDHNVISTGVMIGHNTRIGNNNFFAGASALGGEVKVGNNGMFGLNCTVRDGVTVGDYALVGAAAYVSRDLKETAVIVPARSVVLENKSSFDFSI